MDDSDVYIGSFMFCRHGCEFCNECTTDHRLTNNYQILDQLSAAFPDLDEDQFMDRPAISYVLQNLATETKSSRHTERVFECKKHHKTDCETCFDWAKVAIDHMKGQTKTKSSKVIPISVSREDKLRLLHSMGVELSPTTRLPEDAIEKKFRSAIDASQTFSKHIEHPPFNPSSLPLWSKKSSSKTLLESVRRGNMEEAMANAHARSEGKENAWDLYENTFVDFRQTVMSLANGFDGGAKTAIAQDKDTTYAVCMRVVEVRTLPSGVPVMIILYARGARDAPVNDTIPWVQEVISTSRAKGMLQIVASPEEQKLLLSILNMNARRISSDYSPKRMRSEAPFTLSFLLPIAPLSQQDIGKLTNHSGCVVCGKKTASKCSRCLSAEYCGTDCQYSHWKEHKTMCNSLKGAEWVTVTFSTVPTDIRIANAMGQKMYLSYVNRRTSDMSNTQTIEFDPDNPIPPPPNIHGDNPFLVKIHKGGSMMIYDRTRSMEVYLCSDVDQEGYGKAMAQMSTGFSGLKIYRWAKRTGETTLSVCLNKAPPKDPLW
ncbi:hypothetical protein BDP27DRAFT_1298548 [Rhodocollybia butyracea]|uniref:MYND-type domain-containing protein n=1 Tax=Rhodocollybia butyracea TaxID=206335 RepID=A0A9P5PM44_9AGAR|nr:hypothetical protein BDP27DRAFT_1298548 [Rhodocollybia butyracea]